MIGGRLNIRGRGGGRGKCYTGLPLATARTRMAGYEQILKLDFAMIKSF